MFSIIIPTLFKTDRIYKTIIELHSNNNVGEIIIIDNTGIDKNINLPKVKYILESENIFVNPSWNKGVKISKYDKLCILNDDIWFDWKIFDKILPFVNQNIGMIGISTNQKNFDIYPINGIRPIGYACCFFIHKKNWDEIPNQLKIWAGDDWIFYRSKKQNYIIDIEYNDILSTTSSSEEFDSIKENDMSEMKKLIKNGLVPNYLLGTIWDK